MFYIYIYKIIGLFCKDFSFINIEYFPGNSLLIAEAALVGTNGLDENFRWRFALIES